MIYFYWLSFAVVARAAIILIPLRFCHFYTKTIKSCDALPGRAFLISFLSPFCFSSLRPVRGNASFCVSGVRCTVRTRRRTMPAIKWRKKTFFFLLLHSLFSFFQGTCFFFGLLWSSDKRRWQVEDGGLFPPLPISFLAPFSLLEIFIFICPDDGRRRNPLEKEKKEMMTSHSVRLLVYLMSSPGPPASLWCWFHLCVWTRYAHPP